MKELEKYIREHAAEFDTAEPAAGHEARFLARLDVTPLPSEDAVIRRPFPPSFRAAARNLIPLFALAVLAVALLVIRPGTSHHFLGVPDKPERVYWPRWKKPISASPGMGTATGRAPWTN